MSGLSQRRPPPSFRGAFVSAPTKGLSDFPVPGAYGAYVSNFLYDKGGLRRRGALTGALGSMFPTPTTTAAGSVAGMWAFDNSVLIGWNIYGDGLPIWKIHTSTGNTGMLAPYPAGAEVNGLTHYNYGTSTKTNVSTAAGLKYLGHRWARNGSYVYGMGAGAAPAVYTYNGNTNITAYTIARWDGTAANPTLYANAPTGIQDVAFHYNRLFVAARTIAGDTASTPNRLYWSDAIDPATALPDTAAAWQDDVSGLANKIVVGGQDGESDGIVGLASVNGNLMVLKARSIWMMYGNQPANWTMKKIASNLGCIDNNSILVYRDGVIFMSQTGLYYFDGSSFTCLSDRISVQLGDYLSPLFGTGSWTMWYSQDIGNDYVAVGWAGVLDSARNTQGACWLLHFPTNTWTRFTGIAQGIQTPGDQHLLHVVRTNTQGYRAQGNNYNYNVTNLTNQRLSYGLDLDDQLTTSPTYTPVIAYYTTWPQNHGGGKSLQLIRCISDDYFISNESLSITPNTSTAGRMAYHEIYYDSTNSVKFAVGTYTPFALTIGAGFPGGAQQEIRQEVPTGFLATRFYTDFKFQSSASSGGPLHNLLVSGMLVEYEVTGNRH